MLNIVCINANNYLGRGAEYVNILSDMVGRNISDKTLYKFICFTDDSTQINSEIDIRPLPVSGLDGWWNKLALFKDGLFPDGDRILYLDLDTVIISGLDEIIKYSGEFAILRDLYRQDGYQSSVMMWGANTHTHIWDEWVNEGMLKIQGGDQVWIESCVDNADILQDLYPESFVSYKLHAFYHIPKAAKVVVFHGEPRPHEAKGWVEKVWKTGGGTVLELNYVCNTEFAQIEANINNALSLDKPWITMQEPHDGHAVIVGGGPSLKGDIEEIRQRQDHGQTIFSTNATYQFLVDNGITPDAHVMVDAREDNKAFVPEAAICYYASICHPEVLSAASNLILWHPMIDGMLEIIGENTADVLIGGGGTVGMKSIALAHVLGYKAFHLYGFDSSYHGEENHAYRQPLNDGEKIINVEMNGTNYRAAAWMCGQVENFKETSKAIIGMGGIITVHGYGLLPDVARTMVFTVPSAQLRAEAILSRLTIPNPVGAEIGVFTGALSTRLLENGITLYMVDSWATSAEDSEYAKSGDFHASLKKIQQDNYHAGTCRAVERFGARAKIIRKPSIEAAKDIGDNSLDFVFIDADHSYEGCKADILAWHPKLKAGGLLSGHDYNNTDYPCFGVDKAVDEFSKQHNFTVELGDNFTWFIRLSA
jgi:uncharacterized Rossmann fold enzyme